MSSLIRKHQKTILNCMRSKQIPGTPSILLKISLKKIHQQSKQKEQVYSFWSRDTWCSSSTWTRTSMMICSSTPLMHLIVYEMIYHIYSIKENDCVFLRIPENIYIGFAFNLRQYLTTGVLKLLNCIFCKKNLRQASLLATSMMLVWVSFLDLIKTLCAMSPAVILVTETCYRHPMYLVVQSAEQKKNKMPQVDFIPTTCTRNL